MLRNKKKIIGIAILLVVFAIMPFGVKTADAFTLSCSFLGVDPCSVLADMAAILLMIPMVLASWILWLAGVFLNTVLDYTVVNLAGNLTNITGIKIAWGTIRDLANMSFIFVLLYIAISTILGLSGSQWKKTLISVVIAAILINFSMFFTKVIVDASNIIALGFYKQMIPGSSVAQGLSNAIMQPLGLSTFWNVTQGANLLQQLQGDLGRVAIVSIGSSIFMLITAFVFLAAAIMFVVRFVTIIFLLILSPLAFMASVLPKISGEAAKWWKQLFGQAIFAPLFMIMVWVVLTIINAGGFMCVNNSTTGAPIGQQMSNIFTGVSSGSTSGSGCSSSMGLILNFLVINAFIIGTLTISRQVSEQGGSGAQKLVAGALGLGAGAAAWTGRKSIGRVGQSLADSKTLKDKAAEGSRTARLALLAANKTAKSSFDVRADNAFSKAAKGAGLGEVGFGGKAGGKDGYSGVLKKKAEVYEKRGELYKATTEREKSALKEERGEKEKALLAELENARKNTDTPESLAEEKGLEAKIETTRKEAEARKASLSGPLVLDQATKDALQKEVAEKEKQVEEDQKRLATMRTEKDRMRKEAGKDITDQLEKLGWENPEKATGDGAKKYKEAQDKIRKDYESGQARVNQYADIVSSPASVNIPFVGKKSAPQEFSVPFIGTKVKTPWAVSEARIRAAEKLRKGKKKDVKTLIDEALKENGEKSEKPEAESSEEGGAKKEGGGEEKPKTP